MAPAVQGGGPFRLAMVNLGEGTTKMFAQRGARTHDPEIKSLMLYRLS